MLARLALLFITVPLIELFLLIQVGERIGLTATVLLVVATGALGATLARQQGLATWRKFQTESAAGRPPGRTLLDGLLILIAGAVLLTPGLLTDLTGFALLIPAVRKLVGARLAGWFASRVRVATPRGRGPAAPRGPGSSHGSVPPRGPRLDSDAPVIEVEASVVRDASKSATTTGNES